MAEESEPNTRGTKFAEQQLLRHGWKQGKGLGRNENGISEAIKVKVKCDKGGIGHKESEQFTFHWWDHVFNKASAALVVESTPNEVLVKKLDEEQEDVISNKKPRKALLDKSALYGNFIKSATLLSGEEKPERPSSSSDDDDEKLDLSSTKKLSDAELMKVCGGRTAHKGARHGLTMSAKLARLEQQEQEFMEKYAKKNQKEPSDARPASEQEMETKKKKTKTTDQKRRSGDDDNKVETSSKETQTKKKTRLKDGDESEACVDVPGGVGENECCVVKKKKKKKVKERTEETPLGDDPPSEVVSERKKKKKKSYKHGEETNVSASDAAGEETTTDAVMEKSKSKKRKTNSSEETETRNPSTEPVKKKKKKKKKLEK